MIKHYISALAVTIFGLLIIALAPWRASASPASLVNVGGHNPQQTLYNHSPLDTPTATITPTGTPPCTPDWQVVSSPNNGSMSDWINGVSAVAANDAWAVGYYDTDTGGGKKTLVEHWNGARWDLVTSPSLGDESELRAVSALAPNDVWAVGWYYGPFVISHSLV